MGKPNGQPAPEQMIELVRLWQTLYRQRGVSGIPLPEAGEAAHEGRKLEALTWISIEVVEELPGHHPLARKLIAENRKPERPVTNHRYVLKTKKETQEGGLTGAGRADVNGIPAGDCELTFPTIHADRWK
jgi:hypothetical protein